MELLVQGWPDDHPARREGEREGGREGEREGERERALIAGFPSLHPEGRLTKTRSFFAVL